jgi:LVIVD repeat
LRRALGLALSALLLFSAFPSAGAEAPTGVASGNVEHLATIPFDAGMATGARLVGKHLYVAGSKSFSIYDVSKPADPQRLSTTPIGFQFANEDVDTNGKLMLLSDDTVQDKLHVWDVSDKSSPEKLAELSDMPDHTFSCVLRCKWAYGAGGTIVDLRNPSAPKHAGNWDPFQPGFGFDVTEVAPGLILTASRTIKLLDARKNPAQPKEIALGYTNDERLIHSNRWPRKGLDKFFLVQGETPFSGTCDQNSGAFMTWDASRWRKTRTFTMIDEYRVKNGTFTDGNPPAGVFGCTNMWFDDHPRFRNGGMVASAFFEHGTRFLNVSRKGKVKEVGHFMPAAGSTIATYWITDRIVYAIDVTRGIDILRFKGAL